MKSETVIEINLHAIENNIKKINDASRGKELLGVVKANAYGHGEIQIAKALCELGVSKLGVARVDEGVRLREQGIEGELLVLGGAEENEYEALLNYDLVPVVYSDSMAEKLNKYLNFRNETAPVHIKFDTGMHRLGLPYEQHEKYIKRFRDFRHLEVRGIMSHFVDAGIKECEWSKLQISRFETILDSWKKIFQVLPCDIHIENTAGFSNFNLDFTNMARLGIAIYGYGMNSLCPVLRLHSVVKDIKELKKDETVSYGGWFRAPQDMKVAVIPVGYGDGFMRQNRKGAVIINGEKAPIVSVVCMDYFMVDVSGIPSAKLGDRVTIIGEDNPANYWAGVSGTIVYEVLTLLNPRIRRIYNGKN
ncbi:MAG: alanine racemase [Oligoflexia bacterium]|nr:alanine racemase [Oligoflexia bacterium]